MKTNQRQHICLADELTPEDRRRQVASILANGVARHRRRTTLANLGQFSARCDTGLDVVSESRLSVSVGLANRTRDPECEVNDERET